MLATLDTGVCEHLDYFTRAMAELLSRRGSGVEAIAAHFRYISKNDRLDIEDDRGDTSRGKLALQGLADDWRYGGTFIDDMGKRREAYNIMLSMPTRTDPLAVQRAAREFAKVEPADHKYVMVLHDHQANPHVHISARAESRHGKRLNPRGADLQRWRDLRREAARSGHRSRGDSPGHLRARQELRHAVAAEGSAGWAPADDAPGVQGHGRGAGETRAGCRSVDARGQGACDVRGRARSATCTVDCALCARHIRGKPCTRSGQGSNISSWPSSYGGRAEPLTRLLRQRRKDRSGRRCVLLYTAATSQPTSAASARTEGERSA